MNLLTELMHFKRLNNNENAVDNEETNIDLDDTNNNLDVDLESNNDDNDITPEDDTELDNIASKASEDPNKEGLIRKVDNAHLVYKRQDSTGTFTELWMYTLDNMQDHIKIKNAILSGTDILPNTGKSEDGMQTYEIWSAGNIEMLLITGLPN